MASSKSIHTIVLDTGPIIANDPPVSRLQSMCDSVVTTPAVLAEIRDKQTRSRVESTLVPFLTIRTPRAASVAAVVGFATKSGDLGVLSKADVELLALTYEVECERAGGDWGVRKVPGGTVGERPVVEKGPDGPVEEKTAGESVEVVEEKSAEEPVETVAEKMAQVSIGEGAQEVEPEECPIEESAPNDTVEAEAATASDDDESDNDSDSDGGWITPSNIKKHQEKDGVVDTSSPTSLHAALVTSDFAMQNVCLGMNLNLVSPSLKRVKSVRSYILRCHGCFLKCKDTSLQFCPRCGQPTLNRVTCLINDKGETKVFLKKNMEWHHRGDRFSIPKPIGGSSNGKVRNGDGGGGKGGWGAGLILAPDQKEYLRALDEEKRQRKREMRLDDDMLPMLLGPSRNQATGRPKVGAGRTVNSRRRR